ncbi:SMC-Scp complex subunit ScpB [Planctomicrobium sp. SH661]|uniref:SMC-Scp complex subunit ScpB n=1 Tax=Planctomicrobium sp. SH661 TaxID=3448124 RepID=UPI003F5B5305
MSVPDDRNLEFEGDESPFKVVVRQQSLSPADSQPVDDAEQELSLDDIEAAYMRALETAEQAESFAFSGLESVETSSEEDDQLPFGDEQSSEQLPYVAPAPAPPQDLSQETWTTAADEPVVSPEQVVEALLFVGGAPLPVKKFLDILGGTHTPEQVAAMLDSINQKYLAQRRPYEVQMVEGGYRLQLNAEYEAVRSRAYGHGPKEVKLAQDALEVLAFVAYQQPVHRESLEETGKPNVAGLIRQLLRRELICVDRSDAEAGEQYRTTGRFLELFGLSSLEDLPQAGTFNFR